MKTFALLVLAAPLALAACSIPDRDYTGATLQVQLQDADGETVSDQESGGAFDLQDDDTDYSVTIDIATSGAMETAGTTETDAVVTSITALFTVGGHALQTPALTSDNSDLDPSFTSASPLSIPAADKGQVLDVQIFGTDSNGLSTNIDTFIVMLM